MPRRRSPRAASPASSQPRRLERRSAAAHEQNEKFGPANEEAIPHQEAGPGSGASRRRFLQLLGATSAAPWVRAALPALAVAGARTAAAQTPEDEEVPPEVRSLLEIVQQRWGDRLDQEQLHAIEQDLKYLQRAGRTLRDVDLGNADEPAFVFRAPPEARR
ncbi:MAG: hypothetical protein ACE5G2_01670 [Candidatus Krumholzibacteriia bacterium]